MLAKIPLPFCGKQTISFLIGSFICFNSFKQFLHSLMNRILSKSIKQSSMVVKDYILYLYNKYM